ncbi:MAG: recombinase family protein [Rhizobiales bacterium]|nr:recombinase family protein [Hyphomicrobiales bacterium]
MRKPVRPRPRAANIRCAIYTRKSSEEGLAQEFNSLDAQREACEAYILSQKHEGWAALPQMYDDGGFSGGTTERPALQRLIADIEAGKIDNVVVYKVDRLTRSLGDFAKIVEVFDRHRVSFVSITQSFNTTTSMGRLTLNMLLSFAQFEREVTGERIRDKIAASKQKGMWMGGLPPLGYAVQDRKLVVVADEAETVRHIYRRYADLGSVRALKEELARSGIVSKRRVDRFGRESGGNPLARGALYLMLQNRIYRGEIVHKEQCYPGEHEAIVDEELWQEVQVLLTENRVERKTGGDAAGSSLLAGLLYDDAGERMTPSHANKKGTRYRYYVSQTLLTQGRAAVELGRRVPAGDVESLVEARVLAFLSDSDAVFTAIELLRFEIAKRQVAVCQAGDLARRWPTLQPSAKRGILQQLLTRVDVRRETVEIALRASVIVEVADPGFDPARCSRLDDSEPGIILSVPARLKRAGMETRLLIEGPGGGPRREPDRSLLRLLARAQRFQAMVLQSDGKTMGELAQEIGVTSSYFTRILRLSFLSPEIIKAILSGQQPADLSAKRLSLCHTLPSAWPEQIKVLGIA